MIHRIEQEDLIIRYFFGEVSEQERSEIEERFLADNNFFEQMLSVEDALIDAHAQGELSESESKKAEAFFATRRDREIKFVQELVSDLAGIRTKTISDATPARQQRRSKWQALLALLRPRISGKKYSFALLLIFATGAGLVTWNLILRNRLAELQARQVALETSGKELRDQIETQANTNEKLGQELEQERNERNQIEQELLALQQSKPLLRAADTLAVSLTLDAFSRGSGELQVIHLLPNISRLQIKIDVDEQGDYKSYDAGIKTFEGIEVWKKSYLRTGQVNLGKIVVELPARIFANDNYTLTLKGRAQSGSITDIGDYSFRIKQ